MAAHVTSQTLLNPMIRLLRTEDEDTTSKSTYSGVETDFGVDFVLPFLRTGITLKGKDHVGFALHRQFVDVCFAGKDQLKQFPLSHGAVSNKFFC